MGPPGGSRRARLSGQELGVAASFLATVALASWVIERPWLSGLVLGLGIGLLVAGVLHLTRAPGSAPDAARDDRQHADRPPHHGPGGAGDTGAAPAGPPASERRRPEAPSVSHPRWERRRAG